jgi:hypothetical protein
MKRAAKRRKNVAHGVSPGYGGEMIKAPKGATKTAASPIRALASFSLSGLCHVRLLPRACALGYILAPLRGSEECGCKARLAKPRLVRKTT